MIVDSDSENRHRAVEVGVRAVLELVADRIEGRDGTLGRLLALRAHAKAPKRAVRLNLPDAG